LIFEQSIGSRGAAYPVSPRVETGAHASMRSSDQQSSSIPLPQNRLLIALLCGALATAVNMAIFC
jgi:hypothetical protein